MLKHIVFDCDGVLWQGTNEGYLACYHGAAVEAGIEIDLRAGQPADPRQLGSIRPARNRGDDPRPSAPRRGSVRALSPTRAFRSFSGHRHARSRRPASLAALSRRYGLSAITGMNADNLAKLLDRFELRAFFRHAISSGEANDPAQQKRTGFHLRQVLDWEAVAPHEALCVGDALVDVQMARQQQVPIVVVLTGHLDERQARDLGVEAILRSVADLPAWIAAM